MKKKFESAFPLARGLVFFWLVFSIFEMSLCRLRSALRTLEIILTEHQESLIIQGVRTSYAGCSLCPRLITSSFRLACFPSSTQYHYKRIDGFFIITVNIQPIYSRGWCIHQLVNMSRWNIESTSILPICNIHAPDKRNVNKKRREKATNKYK